MSKLMENDVYNAAVNGDFTIFSIKNHEHLLRKTYQNDNIIHIAALHKQLDFIKRALNSFPSTPTCESLICDQNRHGNTPLHIAAEVGDEAIIVQLYEFFSTQCGSDRVFPWRVMNGDGNTSAHVALRRSKILVAMYLVGKDDYVARVTNRSKETLLHLAIQYHISGGNQVNEDLFSIVELLLEIESSIPCWADADGSTPLHRAASLEPAYRLPVIKAMLARCSEAAQVHDEGSGNTILHLLTNHQVASYEQGQELMSIPQVYALKDSMNHQGDTPLHLAARNRDTIMVRVLKGSSPELGLKNKTGISADSLVRELEDQMRITQRPRQLTKEELEATNRSDISFLEKQLTSIGRNFLFSQTPTGGNILHILIKSARVDFPVVHLLSRCVACLGFIRKAVQAVPSLMSQQDRNGNTPLHILVTNKMGSPKVVDIFSEYYMKEGEEAGSDARGRPHLPPWEVKNAKGDTPLHVAVRVGDYKFTKKLLELDEKVAGYANNRNQTPLHLFPELYDNKISERNVAVDNLLRRLIKANAELAYMQDEDGLTPLLAAVLNRTLSMINTLYEECPDCFKIADFKGRNLWHLFVSPPLGRNALTDDFKLMDDTASNLVPKTGNNRLLVGRCDNDGNLALHFAIENRRFDFAQFFFKIAIEDTEEFDNYLSLENKEGISSYNLIGSDEHLPYEFEEFLSKNGISLYGHRSLYGVPTTKIEEYANTIGVIAALLATITFTAAFTVPGGLDSSNGTPLLLKNVAFQVFMTADVVAMCSSVMVLFCLLWIMTTGHKKESILLLDVSVFLLQTSFHATIVTFMTGLYVTTISMVPAIAISTCVICTLLIILMHKRLVMLTVVPFIGKLIIWSSMLTKSANDQSSKLLSLISKPKSVSSSQNTEADDMSSKADEMSPKEDKMSSKDDEIASEVSSVIIVDDAVL